MNPETLQAMKRDLRLAELVSAARMSVETESFSALITAYEQLQAENEQVMEENERLKQQAEQYIDDIGYWKAYAESEAGRALEDDRAEETD